MLDIFSTREIATGAYFILFVVVFCFVPSVRKAFAAFLQTALSPILVRSTIIYCSVGVLLIWLLSKLPCWKTIYIKDSVMWILFVGIPLCYGAMMRKDTNGYYKAAILDNLKYTVLFECFFATFTFPLLVEFIIIPFVTVISLVDHQANREAQYARLAKVTRKLLVLIGIILLYFTVREAIEQITLNTSYDMLASLVLPFIFSLFYSPFAYFLELKVQYRNAFMRIGFVKGESKRRQKWHCVKVVFACGLSSKKVRQFMKNLSKCNYRYSSEKEFNRLLR